MDLETRVSKKRRSEFDLAKARGEEAQVLLAEFYVRKGVDSVVAREYAAMIPAEELAGLRPTLSLPHVSVMLREIQYGFEKLVEEGVNPNAAVVLLTDRDVRASYSNQLQHTEGVSIKLMARKTIDNI